MTTFRITPTIRAFDFSDLNLNEDYSISDIQSLAFRPSATAWIVLSTLIERLLLHFKNDDLRISKNIQFIKHLHLFPEILMSGLFAEMRQKIWSTLIGSNCTEIFNNGMISNNHDLKMQSSQDIRTGNYTRDFREISLIAKGGFGSVYKAQHNLDLQIYAIKKIKLSMLSPDYSLGNIEKINENVKKVLNEVVLLSRCNHPNISRYQTSWLESDIIQNRTMSNKEHFENKHHEACNEISCQTRHLSGHFTPPKYVMKSKLFVQMRYYSSSLRSYIASCHLPPSHHLGLSNQLPTSRKIYSDILAGLNYLHTVVGIMHRDLKPENVFIENEIPESVGDFGHGKVRPLRAVVGDLGLAIPQSRITGYNEKNSDTTGCSDIHHNTYGVGTSLYAAPEQLTQSPHLAPNTYDNKVDIYSLGIIIFELFTGFATESERIVSIQNVRSLNQVSQDFKTRHPYISHHVIECCNHVPDLRPNAQQLIQDLKSHY